MAKIDLQVLHNAVMEHGGIRAAGRALDIPESTIRSKLKGFEPSVPEGFVELTDDHFPGPHIGEGGTKTEDCTGPEGTIRRFILTSAQNNTEVHPEFWANLLAFSKALAARLMVSCTVYDRAGYRGTLRPQDKITKRKVAWDARILPYICNHRARLHRRLAFCGELDIVATAKNPLSALESYCGRSSVVIPHCRFRTRCVPSRKHQMPKEMHTTGSCTVKKFISRKAGQVAQFHHVLGALLVEIADNGYFYVHHLNGGEDGSFYWHDLHVADGQVRDHGEGVSGLILGDVHHERVDPQAWESSVVGPSSPLRVLRPDHVFVHDLIDFSSRNHHNIHDPLFRARHRNVEVIKEIEGAAKALEEVEARSDGAAVHVVDSNHHDALTRWIKETDWRDDPTNAEFYLAAAHYCVRNSMRGNHPVPLEWAIREYLDYRFENVRFLAPDQSVEVEGIECGMHGHLGANGARGSTAGFARLGFKSVTAHTHSPGIIDGCYTVGTLSLLDMGYNRGPSSWMHCNAVIYRDGKRDLIFIKGGKWRA